jgi:prepilin-type N-terminal cleavage/methylation domain-containing protein
MNVQKNKGKGFTIIEVVLVLAIAGLIFLMVFIALPALQRSQRDTQRRDDVSRFVSQLTSYATNNRGNLPAFANMNTATTGFIAAYMKSSGGEFKDPATGNDYTATDGTPGADQIQYVVGSICDGENIGASGQGNRQAAVRIKLEGSGFFCQNAK